MSIESIKSTLSSIKGTVSSVGLDLKVSSVVSSIDRDLVINETESLITTLRDMQSEVNDNVERSKGEIDQEEADRISVARDVTQKIFRDGNLIDYIEVASKELGKGYRHRYVYKPLPNGKRMLTGTIIEFFDPKLVIDG
jgi:hypothetical protein